MPGAIQEYWVANATSGAFSLYVKTAAQVAPGIEVLVNNQAILYCDGNDVIDAESSSISFPVPVAQGGTGATTAGTARTNLGATATGSSLFTAANAQAALDAIEAGYRGIPASSQGANYTLVLDDRGKDIVHPSGGGAGDTFTIPANASVAFDVGTVISITNLDSNSVTIAITTDTLTLAGTSSAGSRTLAQNGVATIKKVAATQWLIYGVGLT